jgi:hypothetical protein
VLLNILLRKTAERQACIGIIDAYLSRIKMHNFPASMGAAKARGMKALLRFANKNGPSI